MHPAISLTFFLPLSHTSSQPLELGSQRLHLKKHYAGAVHFWNTYQLSIIAHIHLQMLFATAQKPCSYSAWAVRAKMTSPKWQLLTHCLIRFHEIKLFFPPPCVTDCKVSREQKVGNLTYVPWRYVLGVHMRKETHSDYFLNPSTVLITQPGAVTTGSSWLLLSFVWAFPQGLSERIAQLEVIFHFYNTCFDNPNFTTG